jgi:diguanylate cyclase (GGDEF)-like protein/PAS domain S-box-containing protein
MHPSDDSAQLPDAQLAQALRIAANPIFIVNKKGETVWCNQAYAAMLGRPPHELINRPTPSLTPTRETQKFFVDLWSVVLGGSTWIGELTESGHGGKVIHVEAVFTPLTDANNRPTLFLVLENDITVRKLNLETAWQLANHDRLTGLANRTFFTSLLERALLKSERSVKLTAVLFIDLDGFKAVNDTFGHDAGDKVLVEVARVLKACVRKTDSVARFGGDEFACVLEEVETVDDATRIAQKIIESISTITQAGDAHVTIGASVGISIAPLHGRDEATLRVAADEAMYQVKKAGKNNWRLAELPVTPETLHA